MCRVHMFAYYSRKREEFIKIFLERARKAFLSKDCSNLHRQHTRLELPQTKNIRRVDQSVQKIAETNPKQDNTNK